MPYIKEHRFRTALANTKGLKHQEVETVQRWGEGGHRLPGSLSVDKVFQKNTFPEVLAIGEAWDKKISARSIIPIYILNTFASISNWSIHVMNVLHGVLL